MTTLSVDVKLPFTPPAGHDSSGCAADPESCPLYGMLPANAREYTRRAPHLLEYLHLFPVETYGVPLFFSELKRDLKGLKEPNLIYPADERVFIHIFADPTDTRNFYIPIEPSFLHRVTDIIPAIELKLIDLIDALDHDPVTDTERADVLKKMVAEVVSVQSLQERKQAALKGPNGKGSLKDSLVSFLNKDLTGPKETTAKKKAMAAVPLTPDGRIIVTPLQFTAIEYMMIRDKIKLGVLEPFINDRYIEDITCGGIGPIFIEHKIFKALKSVIEFRETRELDDFVIKLGERIRKPITYRNPIVDATLPDGSRINIVFGTDISRRGSNFTIRKVMDDIISILNLIDWNTCDYTMAAYFWLCIEHGMSLFMSGETASGKTTSLNAVAAFIPPEWKIVSIEDTPELQLPHNNWTREVSKAKGRGEGAGSDVTMFDLLKSALRQRPNEIIVGEIRGVEGTVAFGAMQTGHPVLSTFHAASVEKLLQRLTGDPINIPKTFVDNLNLVVIQSAVKRPSGETVRRMLSVNELVGWNPDTGAFQFVEMFKWNPVTDTFEWTGKGASFVLENKIATLLGVPEHRKAEIYLEVDRRAQILKRLHTAGYTGFQDLFQMMTRIRKEGLTRIRF
ncbi:MAG: type II/IV secretion system ATPase subunit [Methanomicrobiales archaeon]|nr:type II/IV secretion system ATPase subunit [Methanomicrobiales archaeon]